MPADSANLTIARHRSAPAARRLARAAGRPVRFALRLVQQYAQITTSDVLVFHSSKTPNRH
jgi:hypothetical protein